MRTVPKITFDTPIGDDVAADEQVKLASGSCLSDDLVAELVEAAHNHPGRPSLTGAGQHSPSVTLRFPAPLLDRLDERASDSGVRRSDIIRAAVEEYLKAS